VLGGVERPLGQHAEALAGLPMREFAKEGDVVRDIRAVLEELDAAVASARVVQNIMFSVKVDVGNACAFGKLACSDWTLTLLANVPDSPLTLIHLVKTRRNNMVVVNPLQLLRLAALVAWLLPRVFCVSRVDK